MTAQLRQPLHQAGSGVWQPTLQRADSHPCQTPKTKRLRREPAPIYRPYLYSASGSLSVTVCRLEGNMSMYVMLYLLSLSKINLTNVSPSKLSPIFVHMLFACLCRYTFTVSRSVISCSASFVSLSSKE